MTLHAVPSLFSSITCFGVGLFVISRNPKRLLNISFCFTMFALLIQEIGSLMLLVSDDLSLLVSWKMFSLFGEALIPGSWLIFSLIFARKKPKEILSRWSPVIVIFFLLPAGTLSLLFSDIFINSALMEAYNNTVIIPLGTVGYCFYFFLLAGLIVILVNLENTLRYSSWETRWKIKYMIIGFGGIAAFLLYSASQAILSSSIDLRLIPITSTIIVIGGLFILFSVVRFRLLDVDVFVSRYIIYHSLTVLIVGAYLLAVGLLYESVQYFESRWNPFIGSLILFFVTVVLVVVLLSEGLKRKTKFFINRHFYKHKYEFRDKWMEVTEKIGSKSDILDIQTALIDLISETLGSREVSLWLYDEKRKAYSISVSKNIKHNTGVIDQNNSLIEYFINDSLIFNVDTKEFYDKHSKIINENIDLFKKTNASLCVPLLVEKNLVGFLTVGKEITGEKYVTDDFSLLGAVAKQAAVGISNAKLTEEIATAKEMEAFGNFSSFIMHDLKNATSMLSLVAQNAPDHIKEPDFQNDLVDTIKKTTSKMKGLIARLSNVSGDEQLTKVPTNLSKFIEETLKGFNPQSNKLVTISVMENEAVPIVMVDQSKLQNVIENIILNAYESFYGRGEIKISISSDKGFAIISFSDNGPGIPEDFLKNSLFKPFKTMKEEGLGIGLFQSKEIIESHGGRIEVESKEGKGTTFKIYIAIQPLN